MKFITVWANDERTEQFEYTHQEDIEEPYGQT